MQLSPAEKKCFSIFKILVEKAFIPQVKHISGSLAQWNIFQSLVSAPNININEIQLFVDSLAVHGAGKAEKANAVKKQTQTDQNNKQTALMNKTFGGEKFRNTLIAPPEDTASHLRRESMRDELTRQPKQQNSSGIMSNLDRMLRELEENQKIIQNIAYQSQTSNPRYSRPALNQLPFNVSLVNPSPAMGHYQSFQVPGSQTSTNLPPAMNKYRTGY